MPPSDQPRLLGLSDPQVTIRDDRGDGDYIRNYPTASTQDLLPDISNHSKCSHVSSVFAAIKCELNRVGNTKVFYPIDSHSSFFVPLNKLQRIVTPARVLQIIGQLSCCRGFSSSEQTALRDRICSRDSNRRCWKLLVVLIQIGLQEQLLQLIDTEAVSDRCLPIRVRNSYSGAPPPCRIKGHSHPTIDQWDLDQRCIASMWSYAVNAPYFSRLSNRHNHYILENNDVLPIMETCLMGPSDRPSIQNNQEAENKGATGGFSSVLGVVLNESHFNFEGLEEWHPDWGPRQFALKQLHESTTLQDFNHELASLRTIQDHSNEHLIKVVATFEVRKQGGTTYHLLFPCAQGDLWTFWKKHQTEEERIGSGLWMAEQVHWLGLALRDFHNEREVHLQSVPESTLALPRVPKRQGEQKSRHKIIDLFGRHGDVKAENVLCFPDGKKRRLSAADFKLVLNDFGLGRLHSKYSRSRVDPRLVDKTQTYKAPEFDLPDGTLSRVSDIFSFGCMCLEFVTWYLLGWDAVSEQFPDARSEEDPATGFDVDTFFRIEPDPNDQDPQKKKAVLKPQVVQWISRLKQSKHSSCYTLQFLELIEKRMLEPDKDKRIKSPELVQKLDLYARTCRNNPSFYLDHRNSLSNGAPES